MISPKSTSIQWFIGDDFLKEKASTGLDPLLRLLLTSDGTLSTALHAICLSPIRVQIIRQETIQMDSDTAEFLSVEPGTKALIRDVWLWARDQKLVHASSVILTEGLSRSIVQALLENQKPLGPLLNDSGLPIIRDRLQIGRITDPAVIETLGLGKRSATGQVWKRRYRISLGGKLTAFIRETFSPHLHKSHTP